MVVRNSKISRKVIIFRDLDEETKIPSVKMFDAPTKGERSFLIFEIWWLLRRVIEVV